ncbi:porin family protein [Phreatobacter aquaticus]|uniref:Porin family protein n=1 Tax=Phreatobacter aquaticus TaxID=2570229 RepID=A0A4D7QNA3_9HYPH|nr:outer membrane protein [Phreatobacter aquaticus]QCK86986.1 porin family protein [Phreatobacter aquaticus]
MKKHLLLASALVSASVLCATSESFAQQINRSPAPVAVMSWTGFYAGVQLGYGWQGQVSNQVYADPTLVAGGSSIGAVYGAGGVVGGAHVGWNYQLNSLVLGIETDLDLAGIRRSQSPLLSYSVGTTLDPSGTNAGVARVQADWLGSLRARFGVLVSPNLLLYATGGLAYGGLKSSVVADGLVSLALNRTAVGWTAGLGAEWAFSRNWTARLEYRHIELGTQQLNIPAGVISNNAAVYRSNLGRFEVVRAGVSYRF